MIFLIDHNLKGHALILLGAIASQGWIDLVPIQFVTFAEMDLPTLVEKFGEPESNMEEENLPETVFSTALLLFE